MVKQLTLVRTIGTVTTRVEVDVWIMEGDVYKISDLMCSATHQGFHLGGFTMHNGHYFFVGMI